MEQLKRDTKRLDESVTRLDGHLVGLTEEVRRTNSRHDRDRKLYVLVIAIIVALLAVVGFVAFRAESTSREQAQLRSEVLCPLYGIFLGSYDPKTRDNNPDPQARQKYEDAFGQIRQGWQIMKCTDPIVPPRSN